MLGGGPSVAAARIKLDQARIPQFLSTENAVDAIGFLETFARNQSLLRQVPEQSVDGFVPRLDDAQKLFEHVWAEGRTLLYAHEARQLLSAFGIAMTNTGIARTPTEAVTLADSFGYPVVLKVVSPDIAHKTEMGGVRLDLRDGESVRRAATAIFEEVGHRAPDARVIGLTVQPYVRQRGQRELYLGIANDPASGVSRRDRSRAGQAFARLQRNGRDLPDCGIDLIERAFRPRVDLDGVVIALAARLHAGGGIGVLDAAGRGARGLAAACDRPGRRDQHRLRPLVDDGGGNGRQRRHAGVVAELRRPVGGAACQSNCKCRRKNRIG